MPSDAHKIVMLSFVKLNFVMLNVVLLSVIMLNVVAPFLDLGMAPWRMTAYVTF
jgi:hypothetical protein